MAVSVGLGLLSPYTANSPLRYTQTIGGAHLRDVRGSWRAILNGSPEMAELADAQDLGCGK